MEGGYETIRVDRDDAVATLILNRPDNRNAIIEQMCVDVYDAVRDIASSDSRVLILRGAGDDFCVGADLRAGQQRETPPTLEEIGPIHHAATLLHTMPQVTIAAIDGGCAGAGMGWAAACDFRFASDRARFSTGFLNVGLSTDMGLPWTLFRIVGPARAREMLFFPDRFEAQAALDAGLVTQLFTAASLHEEVRALAGQLCERDPFALRMMKANCISADELSLHDFIDIETTRQLHCTNRPGLADAMAASDRRFRKG